MTYQRRVRLSPNSRSSYAHAAVAAWPSPDIPRSAAGGGYRGPSRREKFLGVFGLAIGAAYVLRAYTQWDNGMAPNGYWDGWADATPERMTEPFVYTLDIDYTPVYIASHPTLWKNYYGPDSKSFLIGSGWNEYRVHPYGFSLPPGAANPTHGTRIGPAPYTPIGTPIAGVTDLPATDNRVWQKPQAFLPGGRNSRPVIVLGPRGGITFERDRRRPDRRDRKFNDPRATAIFEGVESIRDMRDLLEQLYLSTPEGQRTGKLGTVAMWDKLFGAKGVIRYVDWSEYAVRSAGWAAGDWVGARVDRVRKMASESLTKYGHGYDARTRINVDRWFSGPTSGSL